MFEEFHENVIANIVIDRKEIMEEIELGILPDRHIKESLEFVAKSDELLHDELSKIQYKN